MIYDLCKKLPKEEAYNLISQMERAGLSVFNHLAEGASRKTKAVKIASLNIKIVGRRNL